MNPSVAQSTSLIDSLSAFSWLDTKRSSWLAGPIKLKETSCLSASLK